MPALVCLAVLTFTLPPLGVAASDPKDALRAWRESLRDTGDTLLERRDALAGLRRHDAPEVVEALLDYLPRCELPLLPEVRRQLAVKRDAASLELLRRDGLTHAKAAVRRHVALALGEGRPPGDEWGAALMPLLDDSDVSVRAAAIEALGRLRHGPAVAPIAEALRSEFVTIRMRVPAALSRLVGERAVTHIVRGLDDTSWRVRSAAARALGDCRSLVAVKALVARLPRESGRVREELLASLRALTGQSFGMHLDAWKRWIELARVDLDDPAARLQGERVPASVVAGDVDGVPRYYGVPTLSSKFIFVTDVSGSMDSRVRAAVDRFGGPGATRLDVAKNELRRLIAELPEHIRFNLVTFSAVIDVWRDQLLLATSGNQASGRLAVDDYAPTGLTNLHGALELVLDLAEDELRGRSRATERAPDTVFLLSDGQPSYGEITDRQLLLDYVIERNRDLDLRIHCVAFDPDTRFLGKLTEATGGTLVTPLK